MEAPTTSPTPQPQPDSDWTTGPARTVAALVLGAASVLGMTWGILAGRTTPVLTRPAAQQQRAVAEGSPSESAGKPRSSIANRVNLNTASSDELQLLPGIGPALAARIIEDREHNGPFKSIADLDRVKGIGPRTIERLRELATVE